MFQKIGLVSLVLMLSVTRTASTDKKSDEFGAYFCCLPLELQKKIVDTAIMLSIHEMSLQTIQHYSTVLLTTLIPAQRCSTITKKKSRSSKKSASLSRTSRTYYTHYILNQQEIVAFLRMLEEVYARISPGELPMPHTLLRKLHLTEQETFPNRPTAYSQWKQGALICKEYIDQKGITLYGLKSFDRLYKIPGITDIVFLTIDRFSCRQCDSNTFEHCSALQYLNLGPVHIDFIYTKKNKIDTIASDAFENIPHLQELYIRNCTIHTIHKKFLHNIRLDYFEFQGNHVSRPDDLVTIIDFTKSDRCAHSFAIYNSTDRVHTML